MGKGFAELLNAIPCTKTLEERLCFHIVSQITLNVNLKGF